MIKTEWVCPNDTTKNILQQIFQKEDLDNNKIYILIYEQTQPVGIGAISEYNHGILISNVGVLENFRKQGLGDLIIRMLIRRAFDMGFLKQYAYVNENVVDFFKKENFTIIQNDSQFTYMCHNGDVGGCCN